MSETKTAIEAVEELKQLWTAEFKPQVEAMSEEAKQHGAATAETKQVVDRIQDRLDDIEAKATKAALHVAHRGTVDNPEVKDFMEWTRKGTLPAGSKVMTASDQSTGGVFAPAELIATIIQGISETSPMRQISAVRSTSHRSVAIPKRTGRGAALWIDEVETRTETTTPTYGLEEVATHELYARVLISLQDLEDANVDLESVVTTEMREQFGLAEATALISGNHPKRPEGLLTNADVARVTAAGTSIAANDLINLRFELKEPYWAGAKMILNRLTLRDIRLLKDGNGNYVWTPGIGQGAGLAQGVPATIVDTPYVLGTDMPLATAGLDAIAVGDFKKGYQIVDRIELQWLRDPYTAASNGAVVFHGRKRVGGQVVLPEAVKVLRMHA